MSYMYQTVYLKGGRVPLRDLRWYKINGRAFGVRVSTSEEYTRLYDCDKVIPDSSFIEPRAFGEDEELPLY